MLIPPEEREIRNKKTKRIVAKTEMTQEQENDRETEGGTIIQGDHRGGEKTFVKVKNGGDNTCQHTSVDTSMCPLLELVELMSS